MNSEIIYRSPLGTFESQRAGMGYLCFWQNTNQFMPLLPTSIIFYIFTAGDLELCTWWGCFCSHANPRSHLPSLTAKLQPHEFLYSSYCQKITNKNGWVFFNSRSDAYSKVVAKNVKKKIIIPQYLGEEKHIKKKKKRLYLFIHSERKENHIKKISGSALCLKDAQIVQLRKKGG